MQEQFVHCCSLTSHQKKFALLPGSQDTTHNNRLIAYVTWPTAVGVGNSFILSNYIESYECEFLSSKAIIASVFAYYVK